ncbi:iron-siderophore ABC transporter substrate-binding protein [Thermasporomyces composti]|jgi:iron complex transport system substrate-binding protein|uniref:Iron complex transport system substrate-binding protein n=1 Tax=Thermasporomyces composti TaxID=696763 RepID=A0A3D9V4U9_THECX|nr:iron-siderophore ABC transporter substrate-binding protein [Thermasporomyces composti]REF35723.1 iron complex transport system substrate-binding protein [Thermasporomyces composti]
MTLRRTFLGLVCVAALAACGTTEDPSGAAPTPPATTTAEPITLTDARNKPVTLPNGPATRVVALEWSEAEILVTLGVMPVGVADVKGFSTWVRSVKLDADVADVGTRQEPSVDSIVALEPDLIITEDNRGEQTIAQLEKAAPVLVMRGSDASRNIEQMKDNVRLIATAVGKEEEAEAVLEEFDATLAEGQRAIADAGLAGAGFAMADAWTEGSSVNIRMFGKGSLMSDLAEELGLRNQWTGEVDEVWGLGVTDVEGLTALPDVHFFYSASEEDVFTGVLADQPIWRSLPFVTKGQVYKLEPGTWTFGGPRSCEHFINQVVTTLTTKR